MRKVKQINPITFETICMYDTEAEAADALDLKPANIQRACNEPTRTAGGFFFRYCDDEGVIIPGAQKVKPGKYARRAVRQFDSETGKLIASYESVAEASRATGVSSTTITMACKGQRNKAGGFSWNYESDNTPPRIFPHGHRFGNSKRAVAQLDPESLAVITVYSSLSEAAAAVPGASVSNIIEVCTPAGRRKTSGGYKWMYVDE